MALLVVHSALAKHRVDSLMPNVTITQLINWIDLVATGKTFEDCNVLVGVWANSACSRAKKTPKFILEKACKHRELYYRYHSALETGLDILLTRINPKALSNIKLYWHIKSYQTALKHLDKVNPIY